MNDEADIKLAKEALLTKNNAPTVQGYPLIRLGYGKVEVGTGECEGEPVILFTNHGTGVIGENTVDEPRVNDPKDVYAAISITNIDSLNVVREQLDIFASKYLNEVAPTVQREGWIEALKSRMHMCCEHAAGYEATEHYKEAIARVDLAFLQLAALTNTEVGE